MNTKTLIVIVAFLVLVVIGTLLLFMDYNCDEKATGAVNELISDVRDHDFWFDKPSSGLTVFDYSSEFANRIDWESGVVQVCALGYVPGAKSLGEVRVKGEKIARLRAYDKLSETVKGINFSSKSTLENEMTLNSFISTSTDAFIKGARQVRVQNLTAPDNTPMVMVTLELPLKGSGALYEIIREGSGSDAGSAPEISTKAESKPIIPVPEGAGGLIINAEGFPLLPAFNPRILDESNNIVYNSGMAEPAAIKNNGVVSYRSSIVNAKKLPMIDENALIISPIRIDGPFQADIVISNSDAEQVRMLDKKTGFMSRAGVAFVLSGFAK